ncbi:type II toxin-antitoxin system Phd/YefM family antitoxin [Rickettsia endosymbiont of Orchestes rusci]|uniref:type II toxin-antitoxin system Phd/YefM family antitoxin n=1 Tax=Rickettsia endosymbiont of Orchestes rusci TaxID=3066250 RepID=UPI00313B9397
MDTINYSVLRGNLASIFDKVNENHSPIIVTRQKGKPSVIISLEDFKSYEETAYLMAGPPNFKCLNKAINEIEQNKVTRQELSYL